MSEVTVEETAGLTALLRALAAAPTDALLRDRELVVGLLEQAGWSRSDDVDDGERWLGPQEVGAVTYLQRAESPDGLAIGVLTNPVDRAGAERLRLEVEEALLARPDRSMRLVETDDVWHRWSDGACFFDLAAEDARMWRGKQVPPFFQLGIEAAES